MKIHTPRYARTCQVIMKLMEKKALPRSFKFRLRIISLVQPLCRHSRTFGRATQQFILTVIPFHGSLRSIAARTVYIHQQFTVEYRKLLMLSCIIFIKLIAGSTDHLDVARAFYSFSTARTEMIVGEPPISPVIITVNGTQRTFLYQLLQFFTVRQILILKTVTIVITMRKHDLIAINTLPQSDGKRIFLSP